jgi:TolA-binding protein
MGLGSTAKKLQKLADIADDLYTKVSELKTQLQSLQGTVDETNEGVADIERELTEQRALLEAIADEQGIDIERVLTEAVIEDAEAAADEAGDGSRPDDAATDGDGAANDGEDTPKDSDGAATDGDDTATADTDA